MKVFVLVFAVVALLANSVMRAKLSSSAKTTLDFLRELRGYYWITVVAFGLLLTIFRCNPMEDHPGWYFLFGLAAAVPVIMIQRSQSAVRRKYGSNADKSVEELRREYESDQAVRLARADLIVSCPSNAANPYEPEYQMTPEQHLDLQVIRDWRAAGCPTSNKCWTAKYGRY